MDQLVEEIAKLCDKVNHIYYQEKDPAKKIELKQRYDKLSIMLEQAVKTQFKKNDKEYLKGIGELKKSNKKLEKLQKDLQNIPGFFADFIRLLENIDTLLTSLLPGF